MENWQDWLKTATAAAAAAIAFLFGRADLFLRVLVAFIALDFFTGICAAYARGKKLNSKTCMQGIAKKILYLSLVCVGNLMDIVLNSPLVLRTLVCGFLVANEGISILENCKNVGIPIPLQLKSAVSTLQKATEAAVTKESGAEAKMPTDANTPAAAKTKEV